MPGLEEPPRRRLEDVTQVTLGEVARNLAKVDEKLDNLAVKVTSTFVSVDLYNLAHQQLVDEVHENEQRIQQLRIEMATKDQEHSRTLRENEIANRNARLAILVALLSFGGNIISNIITTHVH